MNKELEILIGLPGSGKSTYAESKKSERGTLVVSSDDIRKELFGDFWQDRHDEVFEEFFRRIQDALHPESGVERIIADATNIRAKYRKRYLSLGREKKARVSATFFQVHPEVAFGRNSRRIGKSVVKEDDMRRQFANIDDPRKTGEPFDSVRVIRDESYDECVLEQCMMIANAVKSGNRSGFASKFFPKVFEWTNAVGMSHDTEYHTETVSEHMLAVVEASSAKDVSNEVFVSTIFHDFGKFYAKRFNPDRGRYTFEKHADVSLKVFEAFYETALIKAISDVGAVLDVDTVKKSVLCHNDYDRIYMRLRKKGTVSEENLKIALKEYSNTTGFGKDVLETIYWQWICDNEGSTARTDELEDEGTYCENLFRIALDSL